MRNLALLKIDGTKAFHSWSVDDVASIVAWYVEHFAEGGGVHASVMHLGDITHLELSIRD